MTSPVDGRYPSRVKVGDGLLSHATTTRNGKLRTLCGFSSRFHRLTGIADGEPSCDRCRRALIDRAALR